MGNTTSTQEINNEKILYDNYINDYKKVIIAQQEQINQLSTMNLKQNIKSRTTSNMFFNDVPNQTKPNSQFNTINTNLIENNKPKLDPYKIIDIDRNYDETMLKKAYLKKALKTHPDRGGTSEEFQKVSIAYTILLKKLNDLKNNNQHYDLRDNSKQYMTEQSMDRRTNVKMTEDFDVNLFNKIYSENKINTPFDQGYGDWINQNTVQEKSQKKLFNGNFNKNLFNHEFEKYKKEDQKKNGDQLIVYENPEVGISYKGKDSIVTLGQGTVNDFSGETCSGLNFRDYRDAFTNSCLIDVHSFKDKNRAQDMNSMESSRSSISYDMSEQDKKRHLLKQINDKREEEKRIKRLQIYEQKSFNTYDKIHQRMLNN